MDFWSYPAKTQQAVKVGVSVSGALQPDPDPLDRRARVMGGVHHQQL